jgi:Methyltransferase domain
VTGIDVNAAMAPYAMQAAQDAGLPADRLHLVTGDVQALPFADQSFDSVICTFVRPEYACTYPLLRASSVTLQTCSPITMVDLLSRYTLSARIRDVAFAAGPVLGAGPQGSAGRGRQGAAARRPPAIH